MSESTTISSLESLSSARFLNRYCRNITATLTATLLLVLLLAIALWPLVPHDALLAWSMLVCAVQGGQAWLAHRYLNTRQDRPREPHVWKGRFLAWAAVSGAAWNGPFMTFGLTAHDPAFFALLFAIAGVTAYGGMAKLPVLSIALIFEAIVLLPLSAWLFLQGGAIPEFMGITVLLYLAMLSLLFRQTSVIATQRHSLQAKHKELSILRKDHDQRMGRFIECVPGLFFTLRRDRDGVMTMPFARSNSPAFQGFDPKAATENIAPLLALCHPEDTAPLLAELHASAQEQRPCHAEFRIGDPSRKQMMMELTAQPQQGAEPGMMEWHGFMQDITERRRLEEQLNMKSHVLDHSSEALYLIDEQGRFVYVNDQACRQLGYCREELLTLGIPDIDPGFDSSRRQDQEEIVREAGIVVFETQHKRRDGSTFPVEIQASYVEYNEQLLGMCLAHDITERKAVEKSLRDGEAMLQEAQRIAHVGSWDVDMVNDKLTWSDETFRIWEIDKTKFKADFVAFLETVHPDDRERVNRVYYESVANHTLYEVEHRLLFPDGRIKHILERGEPQYDSQGRPVRFIGTSLDITERKRMEVALAQRELEFRSLAENMPDNIARWDTEGRYLYVNPTQERLLGMKLEQLIGLPIPDSHAHVKAGIMQVVASGQAIHTLRQSVMVDGVEELHDVSLVPELDKTGKVVSVLGMGRDMTKIYRMQETIAAREREFSSLAESSPDHIARWDIEGRYLYVNKRLEQTEGKSRTELIGTLIPDTLETLKTAVAQVVATEQAMPSVRQALIVKGVEALHDISLVPEFDASGKVVSVLGMGRDMTSIYRMQEAIAAREQEFRSLAESAPDNIVRYDCEGRVRYMNQRLARQLGLASVNEAVGKRPREIWPGTRFAALEEAAARVVASGEKIEIEVAQPDGQGRWMHHLVTIVPERDPHDEIIGTIAFGRDISERKRLELEVAKREHEFRTLVENAADTVARYGKDMRRLYANPAFAELVEGGAEALIGKKPSEAPGGLHAEVYEEKLTKVLATGEEIEFELRWINKSGHAACSLINLTPEFGKDGTVETVLAVGRDISELYAFREKIHQMAFYDTLTTLPNRALFNDRLRQMIADASWHCQQGGVMMLDMDRFKEINDTMGHAVGDELLREAGTRLSACVRSYDTVARLGGDEFAVLLPDVRHSDDIGRIADKMRSTFNRPFLLAGKEVFVTCSIGIALYPDDSTEADDLLRYADSAMYFAKRSGRNAFRFYSRDLTESANERLMLESELRRAVERDELEMYYQPKVRMSDGAIIGSEALLRWKHPQHGQIPPDKFIPIAEDSGLIIEIGEWVLRESCRAAAAMNGAGKPTHKVAINLSARQFQTGDLLAVVSRLLDETHCHPEWIEMEITESLLLDEDGSILEVLKAFRSLGITVAIDDFGTGYSALSYLARFPITTLKIDRSFVGRIETDSFRAELVKAILSIAHCLGQEVVAEGVETAGQAAFLTAHGCHVAQGYLFSKPVPMAEFVALPGVFQVA